MALFQPILRLASSNGGHNKQHSTSDLPRMFCKSTGILPKGNESKIVVILTSWIEVPDAVEL